MLGVPCDHVGCVTRTIKILKLKLPSAPVEANMRLIILTNDCETMLKLRRACTRAPAFSVLYADALLEFAIVRNKIDDFSDIGADSEFDDSEFDDDDEEFRCDRSDNSDADYECMDEWQKAVAKRQAPWYKASDMAERGLALRPLDSTHAEQLRVIDARITLTLLSVQTVGLHLRRFHFF